MEQVLAILDGEEAYVTRLLSFFQTQERFAGITAAVFTKEESFLGYAKKHKVGMLLCEAGLYQNMEQKPDCQVVLLSARGCVREEGPPVIFKFQSAGEILDELLKYYQELQPKKEGKAMEAEPWILTACAVEGGKTSGLSYALAKKKCKNQKIFYLSLDPFFMPAISGFQGNPLTEAIYFIKQNSIKLKENLSEMIQKYERVDCLFGVSHWADLSECSAAELAGLIQYIAGLSKYDGIIIDAGGFTDASAGAMELSNYIVFISSEEGKFSSQEHEFIKQAKTRQPDFEMKLWKMPRCGEDAMVEELCHRLP